MVQLDAKWATSPHKWERKAEGVQQPSAQTPAALSRDAYSFYIWRSLQSCYTWPHLKSSPESIVMILCAPRWNYDITILLLPRARTAVAPICSGLSPLKLACNTWKYLSADVQTEDKAPGNKKQGYEKIWCLPQPCNEFPVTNSKEWK